MKQAENMWKLCIFTPTTTDDAIQFSIHTRTYNEMVELSKTFESAWNIRICYGLSHIFFGLLLLYYYTDCDVDK